LITAIPSYNEALGMLAAKAAEGSVTAVVALERALRNVREEEQDEVGDVIDRILPRSVPTGLDSAGGRRFCFHAKAEVTDPAWIWTPPEPHPL